MLNVLIATSPNNCVYTLASSDGWYGWSTTFTNLITRQIKPFPDSIRTFAKFYDDCKLKNSDYVFEHLTANSIEHLQNLYPEFFI